jgi:uncharacterized protein (TIGR02246 family)
MKMRLLITLAWLAIGYALPTVAQKQKTVDPKLRQEIEAVEMKFQEAYNNRDVAAIADLYTENAVEIWNGSRTSLGLEAIRKMFADEFATNPGKMVNTIDEVNQVGSEIWETMATSVGLNDGHAARIFVPYAHTWKIRMTYVSFR